MLDLGGGRALVVTTDFFTPVVDEPYDFGAIAASNALSDVWAMGAEPALALNLVAFPPQLSAATLAEVLRGGAEVVRSAGAVIAGGHSIQDKEPKYGLCVVGFGETGRLLTKRGARPGDRLWLTKPLGTGCFLRAMVSLLIRSRGSPVPRLARCARRSIVVQVPRRRPRASSTL